MIETTVGAFVGAFLALSLGPVLFRMLSPTPKGCGRLEEHVELQSLRTEARLLRRILQEHDAVEDLLSKGLKS